MPVKDKETAPEVVALKTGASRKEARIVLFSIDDNDYSIPTKVRPNQGLKIMNVLRKQGETAGTDYMLEALLGAEGHQALMDFDDLTDDELEKIIKIAFEIVAGSLDKGKKNKDPKV